MGRRFLQGCLTGEHGGLDERKGPYNDLCRGWGEVDTVHLRCFFASLRLTLFTG